MSWGDDDKPAMVPSPTAAPAETWGMMDPNARSVMSSEDPGLSATGRPANPTNETTRMLTALPQGLNSYLADLVNAPMDYSGKLMQWLGAVPKGTPLPSEMIRGGGQRALGYEYNPNITAETPEEKTMLDIGRTVGAVGTSVLPAMGAVNAMGPAVAANGMRIAAPSVGRGVAESLASQPGLQLAGNVAGDVVSHATDNPWLGLGASLALPLGANAVNRVEHAAPALTGPEAARRSLLTDAKANGILPTFGTITDSYPMKMLESVISKLPFGDAVGNINKNNQTKLTRAFIDKIPNTAGEGIDAFPKATSENIGARIGKQFNALENSTTVNIDNQVGADIAKAKGDFSKNLEANMSPRVVKQLNELADASAAKSNPQIDGETYKNIRSDLSKMLTSTSGTDRDAVGNMINALDGAVQRSLPKDMVQDWKDARTSWRRFMMLKDATDARHNHNTDIGIIPPGSVAARAGNDKEMNRLAEIGTSFVGDKMPDSGTGLRNFFMQLPALIGAGAGGAINPVATAATMGVGYGANALLNNPYMRRAMINRYANPNASPASAGALGNMTIQQLLAR